jgi:hypothetical protein
MREGKGNSPCDGCAARSLEMCDVGLVRMASTAVCSEAGVEPIWPATQLLTRMTELADARRTVFRAGPSDVGFRSGVGFRGR